MNRPAVDRRAMIVLYIGFVLVGVVTVLPGPLIPELRTAADLSHGRVALLFPAFFIASGLGSVLSDWNLRVGLYAGYLSMACGLVGLALGTWPWSVAAMTAAGLGVGLVAPSTNLLVAYAARPGRRSADLATLNVVWGLGATGCPLLLAVLVGHVSTGTVLLIFALFVAVILVGLWQTLPRDRGAIRQQESSTDHHPSPLATASLWPIAIMVFLYIGIEMSVGGWVVSLADSFDSGRSVALLAQAVFWGALLGSRGLTPFVLRRLTDRQVYAGGCVVSLVGVLGLLAIRSPIATVAVAGVVGFGLGPLFPLTVSFLAERTAGGRSGGWVFAFAGIGGAIVPWLAGRVAELSTSIQSGFQVPSIALVVLLAVFAFTPTANRE